MQHVPPQQTGTGTVPVVALGTRSCVTFAERGGAAALLLQRTPSPGHCPAGDREGESPAGRVTTLSPHQWQKASTHNIQDEAGLGAESEGETQNSAVLKRCTELLSAVMVTTVFFASHV